MPHHVGPRALRALGAWKGSTAEPCKSAGYLISEEYWVLASSACHEDGWDRKGSETYIGTSDLT